MLACIAESNIVDIGILNTILCDAQFVCINNSNYTKLEIYSDRAPSTTLKALTAKIISYFHNYISAQTKQS